MAKFFAVMVDFRGAQVTPAQVHNFINGNRFILRWWSNIPLTWVIESDLNVSDLANLFSGTMNGANYFIAEIQGANVDGRMPRDTWAWFFEGTSRGDAISKLLEIRADTPRK